MESNFAFSELLDFYFLKKMKILQYELSQILRLSALALSCGYPQLRLSALWPNVLSVGNCGYPHALAAIMACWEA
jgi:hypothetical protein